MTQWGHDGHAALTKVDMDEIVDHRGHGVACKWRQEDQGDNSVIQVVVWLELLDAISYGLAKGTC